MGSLKMNYRYVAMAVCSVLSIDSAVAAFPDGVSSGDVDAHSAVIWAKTDVMGEVEFKLYAAASLSMVIRDRDDDEEIDPLWAHEVDVTNTALPVKVKADGLRAGTAYTYVVEDQSGVRISGHFRTAAAIGTRDSLHFGVAGDWRGELAPYPAIVNAVASNLDFMVKLGDTIYADYPTPAVNKPQAVTLADYRAKQNEVYSSHHGMNTWADLQATTAIFSMIDDHEVMNDFAGGALAASDSRFPETSGLINETRQFINGLQAFSEFNATEPLRYAPVGDRRSDGRPDLYRMRRYGDVAATFMVDARSFRDTELPPVANPLDRRQVGAFLMQTFDPSRTLLGKRQLQRLLDGLLAAQAEGVTWKFIFLPEPIQNMGIFAASDRYEGYAAERTALLKFINDNYISNVVFVSADIHGTLVNNLTYQLGPFQPQIKTTAFEISAPSVAFDAAFGPTVMALAGTIPVAPGMTLRDSVLMKMGLPNMRAFNALPETAKNAVLNGLVNQQIVPMGYDPLGIEPLTSGIKARLLQGSYTAVFNYGWTEFEIDAVTQALRVTTHGIAPYTAAEMAANPAKVSGRLPHIVGQFEVLPQ